ncbi:hypothetical protein SUDANB171_00866 [Streptomyces sp. enrichment culture]
MRVNAEQSAPIPEGQRRQRAARRGEAARGTTGEGAGSRTPDPAPGRKHDRHDRNDSGNDRKQEKKHEKQERRRRGRPSRSAVYRNIPKGRLSWLLLKDTVTSCSEHRVMGMAAEAAFFTLLSLPPLLLGLIGLLSSLDAVAGTTALPTVRGHILELSGAMLSDRGVDEVITPLINDLVSGPRPDVMSFGFIVALWSGSRAMNVFVGTITVMYGLDGHRNPATTRLLAFSMYVVSMVVGAIAVPAMVIGPGVVAEWVPQLSGALRYTYWPLLLLLCVSFLTTLYHVSVPVRSPWREDIPGALVALTIWAACAYALKAYLRATVEGPSMYGSLAVPVAILLWLALSAFAVLVGAALNAAVDRIWPTATTAAARAESERARAAAGAAMAAAVKSRRSRAEAQGIPEPDDPMVTARRWAKAWQRGELREELERLRRAGDDRRRRIRGTDRRGAKSVTVRAGSRGKGSSTVRRSRLRHGSGHGRDKSRE